MRTLVYKKIQNQKKYKNEQNHGWQDRHTKNYGNTLAFTGQCNFLVYSNEQEWFPIGEGFFVYFRLYNDLILSCLFHLKMADFHC